MSVANWVKNNKFLVLILLAVAWLFINLASSFMGVDTQSLNIPSTQNSYLESSGVSSFGSVGNAPSYKTTSDSYTPQTNVDTRLVIQESNLSLLVKDVVDARNKILEYAASRGGYMVTSSTSNPQDAPTATITIRVPTERLQEALDYFHKLSVKVVSENLRGQDVTDQYVDIEKRISQIERTMTRLEEILDQATQITEITNLTQQILSYQNQIDSLKGQQEALKQNAELAKVTIYLSTDEIALPYSPSETFRPEVTFKLSVRSLVRVLRALAKLAIFIGVFSVIWVPALLLIRFYKKWRNKKKISSPDEAFSQKK